MIHATACRKLASTIQMCHFVHVHEGFRNVSDGQEVAGWFRREPEHALHQEIKEEDAFNPDVSQLFTIMENQPDKHKEWATRNSRRTALGCE